jgi:hypothetical protein
VRQTVIKKGKEVYRVERAVDNLVRVSKAKGRTPFAVSTLYKLHHTGKLSSIFIKLSGALFVDLDELAAVIEKNRG